MNDLLFYLYGLITHIAPFLAVLLLWKREKPLSSPLRYVMPIAFAFYVTAVFHITGAGTLYEGLRMRPENFFTRINPYPFANDIDPVGYALNVVMLMPFGFLLPLMCPGLRKLHRVTAAGFGFSLLIELSQILSLRGTDVDDLILNTLGAAAGFLLFKLWECLFGSRPRGFSAAEAAVWVLAVFLGRFLLYNYLGLINLVYGF